MVLMLKMIFKLQLTCIYISLVPGTDLPLFIIVVFGYCKCNIVIVVVVVVAVVIVPYDE